MTSPFPPGSLVAAYLRDSGGDDQDLSVEQQEASIREWCQQNGVTLSILFKDIARSGSSVVGRDQFEAMMRYFTGKRVPELGIVVWKYSRFAREIDDAQFYKADLRRRGYIIHSMRDNVPDGLDGRVLESMVDWMNARFLKDLSEDIKRGLEHLIQQYGGVPGTPPTGYKREIITIGQRRDGRPHTVSRWIPDPDKWDICREAWNLRASGYSYPEILKRTRLFTAPGSYNYFFTNPIYKGELHYGKLIVPNFVEPMVSPATWNLVQGMALSGSRRLTGENGMNENHPRRVKSDYLLSGLIRCATCGSPMSGNTIQTTRGQVNKYYKCSGKTVHRQCTARMIPKADLERLIITDTIQNLINTDNLIDISRQINERGGSQERDLLNQAERLRDQINGLERQSANLVSAIADAGHSQALLDRLAQVTEESRLLMLEKTRIESTLQNLKPASEASLTEISRFLTTALQSADIDLQRDALRSVIDHIVVERKDNKIVGMIYYIRPDPNDYKDGIMPKDRSHRSALTFTHNVNYDLKILFTHAGKLQTAIS